jgi:hypothetical protein
VVTEGNPSDYGLDDRKVGVRAPVGSRIFTSPYPPDPTSYPRGIGGGGGLKRPRSEPDHSPPTSAEVKKTWMYTSTHPYVFMAQYLVKRRDNFTFFYLFNFIMKVGVPEI